jgi:hypothetical protein
MNVRDLMRILDDFPPNAMVRVRVETNFYVEDIPYFAIDCSQQTIVCHECHHSETKDIVTIDVYTAQHQSLSGVKDAKQERDTHP